MSNPIGGSGYAFDRAMSNGMSTYSDIRLKKKYKLNYKRVVVNKSVETSNLFVE